VHYLPNLHNAVRTATLSMSNAVASSVVERTAVDKQGSGSVALTGGYTGAVDATFDVEVLNQDPGSDAQVTDPQFVGVGNGALSALSVAGTVAPQSFTVRLASTGITTAKAQVQFGPVILRALAEGDDGNGIEVTIDHSTLVSTATDYATREDLPANTTEIAGDEWNFGAADLMADGTIPAGAPRIRFADDPQVYRHYRKFKSGRYLYAFAPAIRRTIGAESPVYLITGSRSVTIAQDATTETLTGVVTLYDMLSKIRELPSTLIEVIGVASQDLLPPDGMGAVDLSFWTSTYFDYIAREGTRYAKRAVLAPVLDSDAPSQSITVQCTRADVVGSELWDVTGAVSGSLNQLTTGVAYSDGPITALTVPVQVGETTQQSGGISYQAALDHGCAILKKPALGANATSKTLRVVWRKRTNDDCDCESIPVVGGPNPDCLGVIIPDEEVTVGTPAVLRVQLDRWAALIGGKMRGVTTGGPDADRVVRGTLNNVRNQLSKALDDCLLEPLPIWQASHVYAIDDIRVPLTETGYVFRVSVAGTSGASQPTWVNTIGSTTTDGGVTWECLSRSPRALWLSIFEQAKVDLQFLGSLFLNGAMFSVTAQNAKVGRVLVPSFEDGPNGHWYMCEFPGVQGDGTTEPTWPTDGSLLEMPALTGVAAQFRDMGAYWTAATATALNATMDTHGRGFYVCTTAGTTHATTEPAWLANTVTDGSVVWTRLLVSSDAVEVQDGAPASAADFEAAFADSLRELYAVAGVNFDSAGGPGTDCWQDLETSYWWVFEQGGSYLPAFNNHYYHSVRREFNAEGIENTVETKEFGFQICACADELTEGDYIDITINVTGGNGLGTYQVGDKFTIYCTKASPVLLSGGTDGDNTLTWNVTGSVDGNLADMALDQTDPLTFVYSDSDVSFTITPGGIAFAAGDQFTFAVEGGQFRWRKNAGSWSADTQIEPTVTLSDGLSAAFTYGVDPSFSPGDSWSFLARAINGVDQLRQPTDARAAWSATTAIVVTPAAPLTVDALFIGDHLIPSTETITLQGSDDNFATTPTSISIPWNTRHIAHILDAPVTRAKWRVNITGAGSTSWVYLGQSQRMLLSSGVVELGRIDEAWRFPSAGGIRSGVGYSISHECLTKASGRALFAMWAHAKQYDAGRLGVLPNEDEPEDGQIVELLAATLPMVDQARAFQPRDPVNRLLSISYDVEPIA